MAALTLRREEYAGLAVAIAAHAALVAMLVLRPPSPPLIPPVDRVSVTLSDEASLTSISPEPMAQAAPDTAPELGEAPPIAATANPEPLPPARPEPRAAPSPEPRPQPRPSPAPRATQPPRPPAKAAPPARTPARPSARASASPAARPPAPRPPAANSGGSRIGDDFLKGVPSARATGAARSPPAAVAGPAVVSALSGAISRQLKPKWVAPQGVDAEKLVTILSWNLNNDGTLAGSPRVVRQDGITDANRPQAARHAEQAIRAVQLAAPFNLPAEYYDAWRRVAQFRFDKRLSQ